MYLNPKKHKEERGLIWRHLKIEYDWKRSLSLEDGRYLLRVHIDRGFGEKGDVLGVKLGYE